ncbi:MAG: AsmA family protein [Gammaproteobacteria bacterium]|nr:AsmA family protein [Gammaproteobacteria bacterium]
MLAVIILLPALLVGLLAFLLANPDYYREALANRIEEASGFSVAINGEMSWRYLPPIAITANDIEVHARGSDTSLASLASAEIDVALIPLIMDRAVLVDALTVQGLTINAVVDASGHANWNAASDETPPGIPSAGASSDASTDAPTATSSSTRGATSLSLDISEVRILDTVINYKDEQAGDEYRIEMPRLATGPIAFGSPTRARLSMTISNLVTATNIDINAEGQLTLEEGFAGVRFDELAIDQRLTLPDMAPITLDATLTGRYDINKSLLDTQLAGTLDGNSISGKATVDTAGMTRASFDLDIEAIDGDKYVPQAATATPAAATTTEDIEVLPLESLRAIELDGKFRLGYVTYNDFELRDVTGTVTNRDNKLTFESEAKAYEGTIKLRFTGTAAANGAGQTSVIVDGLDLQALTEFEWITGTLALESNTTFTGRQLSDVFATLDGATTFQISNGTLDVTPAKKLAQLVDTFRSETSSVAEWPDKMPFKHLSGQHRFIAGAAADQTFTFALEVLKGAGTGGFDYFANQLEYDLILSLLENEGPLSVGPGLARVNWPLHCQGPLDASPVELCLPDRGAIQRVVTGAAKQELKRKGEEVLREKLGEGLDKLFNRKKE